MEPEISNETYYEYYLDYLQDINQSNLEILENTTEIIEIENQQLEQLKEINAGITISNQFMLYIIMILSVFMLAGIFKTCKKFFGIFF